MELHAAAAPDSIDLKFREGKTCGGETFLVMRGGFHFAVIIFWLLQFYCRTCR